MEMREIRITGSNAITQLPNYLITKGTLTLRGGEGSMQMKRWNRRGQGMLEYILIIGALLVVVMVFAWDKIYNPTTNTGIITDLLKTLWTTKPDGTYSEVVKAAGKIAGIQP